MSVRAGSPPALARVVLSNALGLAVGYLGLGLLVESLRRLYPSRGVLTLSFALDALPAQALSLCGLLEPLREAYLSGQVGEAGLRAIFASTALAVIFLLAATLGLLGAALRAFFRRRTALGE
ncbi:MAG: hypothetical protein ACLPJH_19385 [Myxococcaceae bacterium]